MKRPRFASVVILAVAAPSIISAQSGGTFEITQSVVAGGGSRSDGGIFSLTGTLGQPAAGISNAAPFGIRGGFWQSTFAPSAALVSVKGRVVTAAGQGIFRAEARLGDSGGTVRIAATNSLGYFQFDDVEVGSVYVISLTHKTYLFSPQIVSVQDEITDLVFLPMN